MSGTGNAADALRRTIVLPPDLFVAVDRLAQCDGFASLQAWTVVRLQAYADSREGDLPQRMRSGR